MKPPAPVTTTSLLRSMSIRCLLEMIDHSRLWVGGLVLTASGDELAPPESEAQQIPRIAPWPFEDAHRLLFIQEPGIPAERPNLVSRALAETVEEPLVDRNTKTLFWSIE